MDNTIMHTADDAQTITNLVAICGGQLKAVDIFEKETGHRLSQATISKAMRGVGGKPAMISFLIYGLTNALKKKN